MLKIKKNKKLLSLSSRPVSILPHWHFCVILSHPCSCYVPDSLEYNGANHPSAPRDIKVLDSRYPLPEVQWTVSDSNNYEENGKYDNETNSSVFVRLNRLTLSYSNDRILYFFVETFRREKNDCIPGASSILPSGKFYLASHLHPNSAVYSPLEVRKSLAWINQESFIGRLIPKGSASQTIPCCVR